MSTDILGDTGRGAGAKPTAAEVRKYVSDKGPLLNTVGSMEMGGELYYTAKNSSVMAPELQLRNGSNQMDVLAQFGGTATFNLNNGPFYLGVFLYLQLKPPLELLDANKTLAVGVNDGWGYACIDSIKYTMGLGTQSDLQISGQSNFMYMLGTCPDAATRSQMIQYGGKWYVPQTAGGRQTTKDNTPSDREAFVFIRLPWTSMMQKKGVDSSLLTAPIQVTIRFRPLRDWWWGDYDSFGPMGSVFKECILTTRDFTLTDQSMSLRDAVRSDFDKFVSLPFQFQSEGSESIDVNYSSIDPINLTSTSQTLTLRNFINADLTQLCFMVVRDQDNVSSSDELPAVNNKRKNPIYGIKISEWELLINNQPLASFKGDTYEPFNQNLMIGSSGYCVEMLVQPQQNRNTAKAPGNVRLYQGTMYSIIMTQKNPLTHEEAYMMNSVRFGRQTLTLRFKVFNNMFDENYQGQYHVQNTLDATKPAVVTEEKYHFHFLQNYNAVARLGLNQGGSDLVTM